MRRRGFTLIELLMVIAIIGILATALFVSLSNAKVKAVNAKLLNDFSVAAKTATMCSTEDSSVSVPISGTPICSPSNLGNWPVIVPGNEISSIGWDYDTKNCNGGINFTISLVNTRHSDWELTCNDGGCTKEGSW